MVEKELVLTQNDYTELLAPFNWSPMKEMAAVLLSQGFPRREVSERVQCGEGTIYRWLNHPEFSAEVDALTFVTGIATKAARVRLAKQMVRQRTVEDEEGNSFIASKKDVLEWLKFIKDEMEPFEYAAFLQSTFGPAFQRVMDDNSSDE